MHITGLNHITLAITDIQKSFKFYRDLLQFKPLCFWDKGAYFLAGDTWFCLNVDPTRTPHSCYTHYAFSVNLEEFGVLSQRLIQAGVPIFKENTFPGESLYFLDPDGHKLEIHVGGWKTRIEIKKNNLGSWKNVEWFV